MATTALQREFKVLADASGMRAFLRLSADEDYAAVGENDLILALETARIPLTDQAHRRITELLALFKAGPVQPGEFVLAEGLAPTPPQDARFALVDASSPEDHPQPEEPDSNCHSGLEHVNFFEQTRIRTVQADDVLGHLEPAAPGRPGTDVFGRTVPPVGKPAEVRLGDNVALDPDGRTVRAVVAGKINYSRGCLSVQSVIELKGNVDFETGSIDAPTDVLVRGDVQDGFHVHAERNVSVNGFIGAAEVTAGGDVHVRGGISGKEKGRVEAQGEIVTKFCNEAHVRAVHDLIVAKEAINCHLHTLGRIRMPHGSLIGGYCYARGGGDIKVVGSDGNVRTQVAIGIDPAVFDRCGEIDLQIAKRREAAARIRQAVEPLLAQRKRLLPAQRERATELMYEADQIDAGVQAMLDEKDDLIRKSTPDEPAFLFVASQVLPGATIIIGDRMTTFTAQFKGPIRIECRKVDRVEEIVAVNQLTGSVTVLPSRDYRLKISA